jgi:hypothetical protein
LKCLCGETDRSASDDEVIVAGFMGEGGLEFSELSESSGEPTCSNGRSGEFPRVLLKDDVGLAASSLTEMGNEAAALVESSSSTFPLPPVAAAAATTLALLVPEEMAARLGVGVAAVPTLSP